MTGDHEVVRCPSCHEEACSWHGFMVSHSFLGSFLMCPGSGQWSGEERDSPPIEAAEYALVDVPGSGWFRSLAAFLLWDLSCFRTEVWIPRSMLLFAAEARGMDLQRVVESLESLVLLGHISRRNP